MSRKYKELAAFDGQGNNSCVLLKFLENICMFILSSLRFPPTHLASLVIHVRRTTPLGRLGKGGSNINKTQLTLAYFDLQKINGSI